MSAPRISSDDPNASLLVGPNRHSELKAEALHLPSWDLTTRQLLDLELLLNGGFAPLKGYLDRAAYESVVSTMRLPDGSLWPIPVTLDLPASATEALSAGSRLALRHPEGMVLAVLSIEDIWRPDRAAEARAVLGTDDPAHPGVGRLLQDTHPWYVGGTLEGLELPTHHAHRRLRHTPAELRARFRKRSGQSIVAFQAHEPMHAAQTELLQRAAAEVGGHVLIQLVVGWTGPDSIDDFTRVRCYERVLDALPQDAACLNLLPLALRLAGPREVLWHALVQRNHGATHFIVGDDQVSVSAADGRPLYERDAARELAQAHQGELGVEVLPVEEMVYASGLGRYVPRSELPAGEKTLSLSEAELHTRLREGLEIPPWFSSPGVLAALRERYPPRSEQGFTVFFTGFSGSGKSTVAQVLVARLMELQRRRVTLLDGDIVRQNLSSELTFSAEHRDLNIRRIGFVAGEITKNGGVAICAPIAPYARVRAEVRQEISAVGGFILVHISTPLETCEARDRKGLYAKARAGLIKGFTGIDDPYEVPVDAELSIDTSQGNADDAADVVIAYLREQGYLSS